MRRIVLIYAEQGFTFALDEARVTVNFESCRVGKIGAALVFPLTHLTQTPTRK